MANSKQDSEKERGFVVYECGCKDEMIEGEVYLPSEHCPAHEYAEVHAIEGIAPRKVYFTGRDSPIEFRVEPADWFRFLRSERAGELRRDQRKYEDSERPQFEDFWWYQAAKMLATELCSREDTSIRSFGYLEPRGIEVVDE